MAAYDDDEIDKNEPRYKEYEKEWASYLRRKKHVKEGAKRHLGTHSENVHTYTFSDRKIYTKGYSHSDNVAGSKYLDSYDNWENKKKDNKFYGHYLPSHFHKTSIVNTTGRVR